MPSLFGLQDQQDCWPVELLAAVVAHSEVLFWVEYFPKDQAVEYSVQLLDRVWQHRCLTAVVVLLEQLMFPVGENPVCNKVQDISCSMLKWLLFSRYIIFHCK